MPNTSIDSRLMSFGELFVSNYYYSIPEFQRDYSWTEEEVEALWSDITTTIDENRSDYFMGAIVINNSKKPELMLIDGQQRFTTISILMCVIRDIAREIKDEKRSDAIHQRYIITSYDFSTLSENPKLKLNDNNNDFYLKNIVAKTNETPVSQQPKNKKHKLHKSNKLISDAYSYLYENVQNRVVNNDFLKVLIEIEECVREKLISIVILVADEASSYLIFETLNDRGLALSVTDLLKNCLFSRAGKDIEKIRKKWGEIEEKVGASELTKFMRYYWVSKYRVVRERELYREILKELLGSLTPIKLVEQLREAAEDYSAFEKPQDSSVWNSYPSEVRNYVTCLNIFKVTQCYSILLAAKECLPAKSFAEVLRIIVVISLRYSLICVFPAVKLESVYSNVAIQIRGQKLQNVQDIFKELYKEGVYPTDSEFISYFEVKSIRPSNAKQARYILSEINRKLMGSKELVTNPDATQLNLEHILPQKPSNEAWLSAFSDADSNVYLHRLGNMTLLDSSINTKISNNSFRDKCETGFALSQLKITKELCKYLEWGPTQIEERQKEMAKIACEIWRVDY